MTRASVSVGARALHVLFILGVGVAIGSCARTGEASDTMVTGNAIVDLLASGQAVFGIFSGDHTAEQGTVMAQNKETDFVFYSLEEGPFDLPQMELYARALRDGAGEDGPRTLALRIPPIRDGREVARQRVEQALAAGVDAVVFPHVESAEDATLGVEAMGADLWPANPKGRVLNVMIIEDRIGIQHAREIVATPGIGVAIPGPGDLRRAFDGDMEAVENAIQTVLAACKEYDVPCGITAGVNDIDQRLEQGFRFIIVTRPEALAVGRAAAGRTAK